MNGTLGLIVRQVKSGLGIQSKRLVRLLDPDELLVIDSTSFDGRPQYPQWYKGYNTTFIQGFPSDFDIKSFLSKVDTVVTCETFYSNNFTSLARIMGKKTVCIANPEFFDNLKPRYAYLPLADKIIVPSKWKLDVMAKYKPIHIPMPIFEDEFKKARQTNLGRTGKDYLFVNGKSADHDRNGLYSLYEALAYSNGDYTITIKSQVPIRKHADSRLKYDFSNPDDNNDLYEGFDALIHPRRYGGQTLSMGEALSSAMPVIMTDISPNYDLLPKEWLIPANRTAQFQARFAVDIYSANTIALAKKLDTLKVDKQMKQKAIDISQEYEPEIIREKFKFILR